MKDFNAWLADTTKYLRDEPAKPKVGDYWITPDGWGVLEAYPEPCAVCGSAEEVCECEEADYRQWMAEQTMAYEGGHHSHSIKPWEGGSHSHDIKTGYNLNDYTKQFLHAMNQRRRPPRRMNDDEDE